MKALSTKVLAFAAAVSAGYLLMEGYRALTGKAESDTIEIQPEEILAPGATGDEIVDLRQPGTPPRPPIPPEEQKEWYKKLDPEKFVEMQKQQVDLMREEYLDHPTKPDQLSKEEIEAMAREGRMAW